MNVRRRLSVRAALQSVFLVVQYLDIDIEGLPKPPDHRVDRTVSDCLKAPLLTLQGIFQNNPCIEIAVQIVRIHPVAPVRRLSGGSRSLRHIVGPEAF